MKEKIIFEKITWDNLELACKIQNEIFPDENGRENFVEQIEKNPYRKEMDYYIVYKNKTPIAITGIYSYHEYPEVAWLGWFGVLDKYRNRGYGGTVLDKTIELARQRGYTEFRLYTGEYLNAAHKLYESRGLIKELYDNKDDINEYTDYKVYIYSLNLINKQISLWNNKILGLKGQGEKEQLK